MKVKELIAQLQKLDPEVEVLTRVAYGADFEVEWEPVEEVLEVKNEKVAVEREGKWGYYDVPCVRLYAA